MQRHNLAGKKLLASGQRLLEEDRSGSLKAECISPSKKSNGSKGIEFSVSRSNNYQEYTVEVEVGVLMTHHKR